MPSVLFVCTANQYRSPLAAAYFQHELELHGQLHDWTVESAGTWAEPDLPAAPQAQQAALDAGLNLNGHAARQVSLELLRSFDLILAMESGQVEAMLIEFPSLAGKIHLLPEAAVGSAYNVPDPFMSDEKSENVSAEIRNLIKKGFDRLVNLASALHEE